MTPLPFSLDAVHVIGDRVLVRPAGDDDRTTAGLYLPAGVRSKEKVQSGRVVKVGPGHLTANPDYSDAEPWAADASPVRYLPLQAAVGDVALFLRKEAVEVEYGGEAYRIVPHGAILMLVRPQHPEDDPAFDPG
ncbi:MAG: co-chaperone GroES family protein [Bacteroidota bacterium]